MSAEIVHIAGIAGCSSLGSSVYGVMGFDWLRLMCEDAHFHKATRTAAKNLAKFGCQGSSLRHCTTISVFLGCQVGKILRGPRRKPSTPQFRVEISSFHEQHSPFLIVKSVLFHFFLYSMDWFEGKIHRKAPSVDFPFNQAIDMSSTPRSQLSKLIPALLCIGTFSSNSHNSAAVWARSSWSSVDHCL